ncbi:hypothetical protein ACFWN2_20885 [Lentzea sp. NPDC058436]|uniref:hypothetical protein n=1 Tax=Lentzea sp. NPDC058436 TaxID=3346499 RepID=UPI003660DC81
MRGRTFVSFVLLVLGMVGLSAVPASAAESSACSFAAYAPGRSGGNVVGWGEKWDCGGGTSWTITVQRHRGGAWWQNEATNFATGDGWLSASAGCVGGTRTYRTVLQSNVGHQSVSAHATFTC